MNANEYREYQGVVCHFCGDDIPVNSNADAEALHLPEWGTWAAGYIGDFDELGLDAVCPACADRLAGPDWLEKARAELAFNEACLAAGGSKPNVRFIN